MSGEDVKMDAAGGAAEAPVAKRPLEDGGEATDAPAAKKAKTAGGDAVPYTREKGPDSAEVWIREYMSPGAHRAGCVLKARYEDFVVREVTPEGRVARLTALDVPQALRSAEDGGDLPADPAERAALGLVALVKVHSVAQHIADNLKAKLNKKSSLPVGTKVPISGTGLDKAQRTALHTLVKRYFPKLTSFMADDVVQVQLKNDGGRGRDNRWPKDRGDYLHFTMYKENLETQACFKTLSFKLSCQQKMFATAGTKDKRAITAQRVSAYRMPAERIAALNFERFGAGIAKFGDFTYEKTELKLGMLAGNRFSIVMRRCGGGGGGEGAPAADIAQISATLEAAKRRGFINYYGNQRFGSTKVPTYKLAEHLLAGDGVAALKVLFHSKAEIVKEFAPAAEAYANDPSNPAAALDLTPRWCSIEASVLRALLNNPKDIMAGFNTLHRNTRCLYFHALQSVVWNQMASERIRRHGAQPVEGDLVYDGVVQAGRAALPAVRTLTKDDVAQGADGAPAKYTLADVILPLPGCDPALRFPEVEGVGRAAYVAALAQYHASGLLEDGGAGSAVARGLAKSLNLFGGYRCLAVVPGDFTYSFTRYADDTETIQRTEFRRDTDADAGAAGGALVAEGDPRPVAGFTEPTGDLSEGPQLAMRLSFTLPSSAYATMFIREVANATTCNV